MSNSGGTSAALHALRSQDDIPLNTSRLPAREAARRELSKSMYHGHDPNLLQRAIDHFWKWIGSLLDSASGMAPGGTIGLVVIVLIVVALLTSLWWRFGTPRRTPGTAGGSLFTDSPLSAVQHRSVAETHAAAERWNDAVQERMRAIVRALEERALLDPHPGRTADEAALEAGRALPAHAAQLLAAAREFDDVTYGGRATDRPAYLRLTELDLELERSKPQLSGAAAEATGGTVA